MFTSKHCIQSASELAAFHKHNQPCRPVLGSPQTPPYIWKVPDVWTGWLCDLFFFLSSFSLVFEIPKFSGVAQSCSFPRSLCWKSKQCLFSRHFLCQVVNGRREHWQVLPTFFRAQGFALALQNALSDCPKALLMPGFGRGTGMQIVLWGLSWMKSVVEKKGQKPTSKLPLIQSTSSRKLKQASFKTRTRLQDQLRISASSCQRCSAATGCLPLQSIWKLICFHTSCPILPSLRNWMTPGMPLNLFRWLKTGQLCVWKNL